LYVKKTAAKTFYVVDGAMNDLVRPALYGAYHEIIPAQEKTGEKRKVDVVGPICESGDFFARDRALPLLKGGDLIAVLSAGAYGFSMASNYNSRRRAAEVLVKGDTFFIIRKRETPRDLTRGETIPDFLKE
jgi:diaminopimelate decarboxylase